MGTLGDGDGYLLKIYYTKKQDAGLNFEVSGHGKFVGKCVYSLCL